MTPDNFGGAGPRPVNAERITLLRSVSLIGSRGSRGFNRAAMRSRNTLRFSGGKTPAAVMTIASWSSLKASMELSLPAPGGPQIIAHRAGDFDGADVAVKLEAFEGGDNVVGGHVLVEDFGLVPGNGDGEIIAGVVAHRGGLPLAAIDPRSILVSRPGAHAGAHPYRFSVPPRAELEMTLKT